LTELEIKPAITSVIFFVSNLSNSTKNVLSPFLFIGFVEPINPIIKLSPRDLGLNEIFSGLYLTDKTSIFKK